MLYGSETWVLQKKNERKMNAMVMRSLRRICSIILADRICNKEVHDEYEEERAQLVWARRSNE